jgi:hypothetical protein
MPDTPDFDTIAAQLLVDLEPLAAEETRQAMAVVAEQLRQVWNARGAADIAKLEAELPGPDVKQLEHALRTLDR